ncbi:MAG TPA: hypothetical protein VMZ53_25830 [Kofleriaceae bacterium]|nr:hypothetical protein [Kofleriaceae bacterium]
MTLADACVELAWAQWVAIGVSGSARPPHHAVDLEAAIAFAPALDDLDPRLHDEVVDWCSRFAERVVSVSRLKQVLKLFDEDHQQRFERFAAIINARGGTKWPTTSRAAPTKMTSEKSRFLIDGAAAVQLRARMIFGIGARADVLVSLLLSPLGWTHVSLLASLAYTKRSLADALGDLSAGGVLHGYLVGNAMHYRLVRKAELSALVGKHPELAFQPWAQRLAVTASLLATTARTKTKSEMIRDIELRKTIDRHRVALASVGEEPVTSTNAEELVSAWLLPLLEA